MVDARCVAEHKDGDRHEGARGPKSRSAVPKAFILSFEQYFHSSATFDRDLKIVYVKEKLGCSRCVRQ